MPPIGEVRSAVATARSLAGYATHGAPARRVLEVGTTFGNSVLRDLARLRLGVDRYGNVTDIMHELGGVGPRSLQGTIENKSKDILNAIHGHTIGDRELIQHMEDVGLAPFRTITQTLQDVPYASELGTSQRPVSAGILDAANRSVDIMRELSPTGYDIRRLIDMASGKASHVYENDHSAAASVGKQIITDSAERLIGKGESLTDEWHKASQNVLDFVDNPDNLRRVARWWNQAKSNKHPDIVMRELNKKFPQLAKQIENTSYLDEVVQKWNDYDQTIKQVPYAERILKEAGGLANYTEGLPNFKSWLF